MARKSTPQALTLSNLTTVDDDLDFIGSPKSPLSPTSPKSPRSPFRFNSSKKSQSELPSMQAAETLQPRTTLPTSQTAPSLSTIQQYPSRDQQKQERSSRSGFFANYKASKSSSRLQNNSDSTRNREGSMSRDTERPAMSARMSSKDKSRKGMVPRKWLLCDER